MVGVEVGLGIAAWGISGLAGGSGRGVMVIGGIVGVNSTGSYVLFGCGGNRVVVAWSWRDRYQVNVNYGYHLA